MSGPHRTLDELEASLDAITGAPRERGILELIVRRPRVDVREAVDEAELDPAHGLVGDRWSSRPKADPETQLTLVGTRLMAALAADRGRWPLAGDQLFVDFDLSEDNLPAGTRLALGGAVLEVAETPHTGCGKFISRFGADAVKFVNSPLGRRLRLRGLYARVLTAGRIRVGDEIRKAG